MPAEPAFCWAGLDLNRPRVIGILNVTPDSFSEGGDRLDPNAAISTGLAMAEDGADIIDVGGESTRPGAAPVPPAAEQDRVLPVIAALARHGLRISIDTRHASTMRAALAAGASIVNDVSGLAHDPFSAGVVAQHACPVVLMHSRGDSATMYASAAYDDVVADVRTELQLRIKLAVDAGIMPRQIALDPGLGFAKLATHSAAVLRGLPALVGLGYPVLVGASRKSFIGAIAQEPDPEHRLAGSLAAGLFALLRGASILRVHDVRETVQAIRVWHTLFDRAHGSPSPISGGALQVPNGTTDGQ